MGFRVLLSLVVLTSCLMINGHDLGHVSWTQAPNHAPSYSPVGAPKPHHGHHKGPGGHHHKPAVPVHPPVKPPVHPPVKAPVHPPTKAPVHPPIKAPVQAPTKAPVHAPTKGPGGHHHKPAVPVHPPVKAPVHPPVKAPVHPPVKAPVHPPTKAPVHPPTKAPVHPPTKAPVHPPTKAPVHPPSVAPVYPPSVAPVHPPVPSHAPPPARKQVAVRGMVYCKACKYKGVDTLTKATPLAGAVVLLTCYNTKYPLRVKGITDVNGFFFIMPPKTLTTFGVHKCKVTLLKSPNPKCNHPTNLHYGVKGATLVPMPKPKPSGSLLPMNKLPFDVYTVGPFAYEPSKKTPCPVKS